MGNIPPTESKKIDADLAEFVDQVWSNANVQGHEPRRSAEDKELAQLQELAQRMHSAIGPARPPEAGMRQRIRQNLVQKWRETQPTANGRETNPLARWFQSLFGPGWLSTRQRQTRLTLSFSLATVALVVVLLWLIPDLAPSSGVATVLGSPPGIVAVLGAAALLLLAAWGWFQRPN